MAKWILEPGHTAAEFCARHMMVTYVRGYFKNIHGTLFFDPANPRAASVEDRCERDLDGGTAPGRSSPKSGLSRR